MKERPILFSGEMVNAILDGRKTQTRRVVKLRYQGVNKFEYVPEIWKKDNTHSAIDFAGNICGGIECPYGQPGDRLWVRETFGFDWFDDGNTRAHKHLVYRADDAGSPSDQGEARPWKPSIHMPRWASRITLEVKSVRVERLQRISDVDCVAEGIDGPFDGPPIHNDGKSFQYWRDYSGGNNYCTPRGAYRSLWNGINGKKPGASWQDNPWVWVVEFEQIKEGEK